MDKKPKKQDIILVLIVLVIGVAIFLFTNVNKTAGATVSVRVDGEEVASFSLYENNEYTINGANNGINKMIIQNGEVWLTEANCPDKLCVNQGKISCVGESIICLPNKVVVAIDGENNEQQIDAVVGEN